MSEKTEKADYAEASYPRLRLEKAGQRHLQRALSPLENVPWNIHLLQLAWTAGPVTFLALEGGYYLTYGKSAPTALLIYFIVYTLIAGIFGIGVKVFYDVSREHRIRRADDNLRYTIDKLFDLMMNFNDFRLSLMSLDERRHKAAEILLKNTHALPASLVVAISEVTNDRALAQVVGEIEAFRRASLFARVDDLVKDIGDKRAVWVDQLSNTYPELAEVLEKRLKGQAPSLKVGIPRADGFLERIFLSAESDDLSLMTIQDAEELLVLIFELISDRKINILVFTYTGNKRLRDATNHLERARAAWRIGVAALNHHIRFLMMLLMKNGVVDSNEKLSNQDVIEKAADWLNTISSKILSGQASVGECTLFIRVFGRYSQITHAYKRHQRRKKRLLKAIEQWQHLTQSYRANKTKLRFGRGRWGLRVTEEVLAFNSRQKLVFAEKASGLIAEFLGDHPERENYSADAVKELAISLALEAQQLIDLSHPIIQSGLESVNAANFCSLEQGISVEAKVGAAATVVKEVEKNIGRSAERLALILVRHYGEKLDPEAITFFHETYGADKDILTRISMQAPMEAPQLVRDDGVLNIKPIARIWFKAKEGAQRFARSR